MSVFMHFFLVYHYKIVITTFLTEVHSQKVFKSSGLELWKKNLGSGKEYLKYLED